MGQNRALSLEAPIFTVASSFLERDREYLQTDLGIVLCFETRLHEGSVAVEFTPVDSD